MKADKNYLITPQEYKIRNVGGKVLEDYHTLKSAIIYFNDHYFRLFYYFDLTHEKYLFDIIQAARFGYNRISELFYKRILEKIENGEIEKEKYINKKYIVNDNATTEEKNKELSMLHRICKLRFNDYFKRFSDENNFKLDSFSLYYYSKIEQLISVLYLTEYGVKIDADKYIKLYTDFTKSSESIIGNLHKECAKALNNFFGGIPITQKEIEKYFIFDNGIAEINIKSVNSKDYARLGCRKLKLKNNGQNK